MAFTLKYFGKYVKDVYIYEPNDDFRVEIRESNDVWGQRLTAVLCHRYCKEEWVMDCNSDDYYTLYKMVCDTVEEEIEKYTDCNASEMKGE